MIAVKQIVAVMGLLVASLQYKLWFNSGSVFDLIHLQQRVNQQIENNRHLAERNEQLARQISQIKRSVVDIEEQARQNLGMVKSDETFYEFAKPS